MEMCHDAKEMEEKVRDVKLVSKARMIAPAGQRINPRFEFQVQAISAEKLPFILHAVVVFTTIAPITDDDDDDDALRCDDSLSRHIFNDQVRGVIERDTLARAASMTMEEMFGATTSRSSVNHQAVFEFENVQLELKQFGRLIVYDAYVYVKPQFVEVLGDEAIMPYMVAEEERERQDAAIRQTVEKEVQRSAEDDGGKKQQAWEVQVDPDIVDDTKQVLQKVQSSKRPSMINELKKLFFQVIFGNATIAGKVEVLKKAWSYYTQKVLWFACAMLFSAVLNFSSSSSITSKILLVVDIVVFIIINTVLLIKLPDWGNALVCISWFLLELATCLLILPFNGCYAFSILTVLFLIIIVAVLESKSQHAVKEYVLPSFTDGYQENDYLNNLFDISNGIATFGGLVTGIMGYYSYMKGPVTAAGFFFFCTLLLGLYLMMIIAMRAVSPTHAACLAIMLKILLLLTIITASISFVRHSVTM